MCFGTFDFLATRERRIVTFLVRGRIAVETTSTSLKGSRCSRHHILFQFAAADARLPTPEECVTKLGPAISDIGWLLLLV
jgi:hypothetical protein